jgi:predicted naringenin-chalcone synthase
MTLSILSIGTAVPDFVIEQTDALCVARALACPTAEQDTWMPALYAGTNIRCRQSVLPPAAMRDVLDGTNHSGSVFLPSGVPGDRGPSTAQRLQHYAELAPPLALDACRRAVAASGLAVSDFTHLITVSCTGFFAPGVDRELMVQLDLAPTIQRTHIGFMGCHGALNGLRVARAFAAAEPSARILLCAVELCSLHYHYGWDPAKMVANALFGDGAASLVGVAGGGDPASWRVAASGSCLIRESADAMTWTVGDHGFEMTLARRVPALIRQHLRPWLAHWLAEQGVGLEGVRSWAVHPGGPRILTAVEEGLGLKALDLEASHAVFAEHGNMSSPTVLFILERLRSQQAPRPCVALAFGPGLIAEATLLL